MSDSPADGADTDAQQHQNAAKRKASAAGLDGANGTGRVIKRRASKACRCCRARKVRCNVTEHGAPCTNCRLDEVECVVSESRRKKRWANKDEETTTQSTEANASSSNGPNRKLASRTALDGLTLPSNPTSHDFNEDHVPHAIYQTYRPSFGAYSDVGAPMMANMDPRMTQSPVSGESRRTSFFPRQSRLSHTTVTLPNFLKPLPYRIGPDEIEYLRKKGALTLPHDGLRNELIRAFIEFVHPFMPCIDLDRFLEIIEHPDGSAGTISLILYQAVMFTGAAFVSMDHLQDAGYMTRKEARKDFFQRTRLLYDFDYDSDRLSLVQALLLLTYYYETPDDQKDTWHWMGVATSLAHTIGLHRNPEKSSMDPQRIKLWKRIWWSAYMRDRLIALGMRRPTRIKPEDFDVPMLTLDDFELKPIDESITCVPSDCTLARDPGMRRRLALMCIEKAKLCLCISHVLSKQYCVLNNNEGMPQDRTTMMLLPKKLDPAQCEVRTCDRELNSWLDNLPPEVRYEEASSGSSSIDLHRSLLHMLFFTTVSALYRPQVLPSTPDSVPNLSTSSSPAAAELLETSRKNVRRAANAITAIAQRLDSFGLIRFLPTTGVTCLLPAIIIHLLDIKSPDDAIRRSSLRGFSHCMLVMGKLRDIYAAADYSTAFLEAAIRKAGVNISPYGNTLGSLSIPSGSMQNKRRVSMHRDNGLPQCQTQSSPPPHPSGFATASLLSSHIRHTQAADNGELAPSTLFPQPHTLTPPPDTSSQHSDASPFADSGISPSALISTDIGGGVAVTDAEVAKRLERFLASTPPASDRLSATAGSGAIDPALMPDDDSQAGGLPGESFGDDLMETKPGMAPDSLFFGQGLDDLAFDDMDGLLNLDAAGEGGYTFGI